MYKSVLGKINKLQKQIMRKARHDQKDMYLALLDFRNTPTHGFNTSPAQRLMNRRTNTLLPTKQSLWQPNTILNIMCTTKCYNRNRNNNSNSMYNYKAIYKIVTK